MNLIYSSAAFGKSILYSNRICFWQSTHTSSVALLYLLREEEAGKGQNAKYYVLNPSRCVRQTFRHKAGMAASSSYHQQVEASVASICCASRDLCKLDPLSHEASEHKSRRYVYSDAVPPTYYVKVSGAAQLVPTQTVESKEISTYVVSGAGVSR